VLRDAHIKVLFADKSASRSLDSGSSSTTSKLPSESKSAQSSDDHDVNETMSKEPALQCASLATGMKCLPASKIPQANGNVLHDWHAEVLAIRGFNSWILEECALLAQSGREGDGQWIEWSDGNTQEAQQLDPGLSPLPPFKLKPDVQIHMFCSQAPCGDASMELTMASQEDATPWATAAPSSNPDDMIGRGHFDRLGVVRRKPARPDAPVTMSKSCSDKLALKQVTGLLSGITAKLVQVDGCYLRTLVMPEAETVSEAVKRAFGREGRMKVLNDWEGTKAGHQFRPFDVRTTGRQFAYSAQGAEAGGSNLSALWTPKRQEILVNGVLQGRKQFDIRGASITSRRGLWKLALEVAVAVGMPAILGNLDKATYGQAKESANHDRREAKDKALEKALTGWKRNERDDDWGFETR
jgi:tRNA-specific adenosine deaminase 1